MGRIKNFKEIRLDGKIIDESMSIDDLIKLGWTPEKIVEIQWHSNGDAVSICDTYGLLAIVVPSKDSVAVIKHNSNINPEKNLLILNSDGAIKFTLSNTQKIKNNDEVGKFAWFEPARIKSPHLFGVIFEIIDKNQMFQFDVDSNTGEIAATYPLQ